MFTGRHVTGFGDLRIDMTLEVQNKTYIQIVYIINYIVYGSHSCYKIQIFKEKGREPTSQYPDLGG